MALTKPYQIAAFERWRRNWHKDDLKALEDKFISQTAICETIEQKLRAIGLSEDTIFNTMSKISGRETASLTALAESTIIEQFYDVYRAGDAFASNETLGHLKSHITKAFIETAQYPKPTSPVKNPHVDEDRMKLEDVADFASELVIQTNADAIKKVAESGLIQALQEAQADMRLALMFNFHNALPSIDGIVEGRFVQQLKDVHAPDSLIYWLFHEICDHRSDVTPEVIKTLCDSGLIQKMGTEKVSAGTFQETCKRILSHKDKHLRTLLESGIVDDTTKAVENEDARVNVIGQLIDQISYEHDDIGPKRFEAFCKTGLVYKLFGYAEQNPKDATEELKKILALPPAYISLLGNTLALTRYIPDAEPFAKLQEARKFLAQAEPDWNTRDTTYTPILQRLEPRTMQALLVDFLETEGATIESTLKKRLNPETEVRSVQLVDAVRKVLDNREAKR